MEMKAFGDENNRSLVSRPLRGRRRGEETVKATPCGVEIVLFSVDMSIINRLRPITKRVEIDAFKSLVCSRNPKAKVCRRKN